jgi:hypothetical protein
VGTLKLIEWFEDDRVELYDLAADPYERANIAPSRPADVARLRTRLREWRTSVGARMPVTNPGWKGEPGR